MKVICIGRNYVDHAKELNNEVPAEPVIFCKPDSALVQNNKPVFIPAFTNDMHHEVELVIRINRIGKHIDEKFAHKYYNEIGIGVDFTARDLQAQLKAKGLPWEKSKGFDGSAPISSFTPVDKWDDIHNLSFRLEKNGTVVQQGNTRDMLFNINRIIAEVSKYFTLKIGDLIFTGTPAGVSPVAIGDTLECFIGDQSLLRVPIK